MLAYIFSCVLARSSAALRSAPVAPAPNPVAPGTAADRSRTESCPFFSSAPSSKCRSVMRPATWGVTVTDSKAPLRPISSRYTGTSRDVAAATVTSGAIGIGGAAWLLACCIPRQRPTRRPTPPSLKSHILFSLVVVPLRRRGPPPRNTREFSLFFPSAFFLFPTTHYSLRHHSYDYLQFDAVAARPVTACKTTRSGFPFGFLAPSIIHPTRLRRSRFLRGNWR